MAQHVIYVPGLGDHHPYGQDKAIRLWRFFGLQPHYFPLGWADVDGFEVKKKRLADLVDQLQGQGHTVSLVGVSAGAGAVLNLYAERPDIHAVVLICGKVNHPETVGSQVYKHNPDFKESMYLLQSNLPKLNAAQRKRILSIHPRIDHSVPPADTRIEGAHEKTLPGIGHRSGIFSGVIFGSASIGRFIKKAKADEP